nr:MAG: hypothetical protein [Betatorquevirus sp.]
MVQSSGTGKKLKTILFYRMTTFIKPSLYKGRSLEHKWVSSIYESHDLICSCEDPIEHLSKILNLQIKKPLCLPSTAGEEDHTHTVGEDAVDQLLEGELDKLFEDDLTEDTG